MTFASLPPAVSAARAHGNTARDINPLFWAKTYNCSPEDVMAEWQRQESIPTPCSEVIDE